MKQMWQSIVVAFVVAFFVHSAKAQTVPGQILLALEPGLLTHLYLVDPVSQTGVKLADDDELEVFLADFTNLCATNGKGIIGSYEHHIQASFEVGGVLIYEKDGTVTTLVQGNSFGTVFGLACEPGGQSVIVTTSSDQTPGGHLFGPSQLRRVDLNSGFYQTLATTNSSGYSYVAVALDGTIAVTETFNGLSTNSRIVLFDSAGNETGELLAAGVLNEFFILGYDAWNDDFIIATTPFTEPKVAEIYRIDSDGSGGIGSPIFTGDPDDIINGVTVDANSGDLYFTYNKQFSLSTIQKMTGGMGIPTVVYNDSLFVGSNPKFRGIDFIETGCGNGILEVGETCDDGNNENNDCCSASCVLGADASSCNGGFGVCFEDAECSAGECIDSGVLRSTLPIMDALSCVDLTGKAKVLVKDDPAAPEKNQVLVFLSGPGLLLDVFDPIVNGGEVCIVGNAGDKICLTLPSGEYENENRCGWTDLGAKGLKFKCKAGKPDGGGVCNVKPALAGKDGKLKCKFKEKKTGNLKLLGSDAQFALPLTVEVVENVPGGFCFASVQTVAKKNEPTSSVFAK